MKVSGFTYVRNGITYDYPFIEAIQSILPICDEFIVVIGDSTDGTREAVTGLNDSRIKIVDTIWNDNQTLKGRRYAEQSNIGLDHISGDWGFHIQADEVVHEDDLPLIKSAMLKYLDNPSVDGFLFKFLNFFGDFSHWAPSRRFHQHEIRILRNNKHIRAYRDSQGFRIFKNPSDQWNEKGTKLQVISLAARIFHYSYARNPYKQRARQIELEKGWLTPAEIEAKIKAVGKDPFDYGTIDYLQEYNESHPAVMHSRIASQDWEFKYDPSKTKRTLKDRVMMLLQNVTGKQFFSYKNYIKIRL